MYFHQYCSIKNDSEAKFEKNNSHLLQLIQQDEFNTVDNERFKQRKENTDICEELRQCKVNDLLEQRRRERLLAESHELRQLKSQLQSALVFKQLREQKNYLDQQKKEELLRKREENLNFAAECAKLREHLLKEEQEIKHKQDAYRGILNKQIDEHRQRRRLEFEDAVKDRKEMGKLIKRIQKEDVEERLNARLLQGRCKVELEEFCRTRELQKQLEKEREVHENESFLAYQKKCDELKAKIEEKKKTLQREREAVSEQIGQQIFLLHNEKQKREDMLLTLSQGERKFREDELYRQNLEKQIKLRQQIRTEQEAQHNNTRIQKEKELKEEEEKLRQEHLIYLTERDKLEQLSDEKRRRKKLEHSKALREMIELRRIERAKEIARKINEFRKLMDGEKERENLIEKERIRMLSTAPKELLKYLPPGVLKLSDKELLTLPET